MGRIEPRTARYKRHYHVRLKVKGTGSRPRLCVFRSLNHIYAQVIDDTGSLVTDPTGLLVTYESLADPDGSITMTSQGKTNFWEYIFDFFGISLAADEGLAGKSMPDPLNESQEMDYDAGHNWFIAEGIPITPYDDAGRTNYYPMMRISDMLLLSTLEPNPRGLKSLSYQIMM